MALKCKIGGELSDFAILTDLDAQLIDLYSGNNSFSYEFLLESAGNNQSNTNWRLMANMDFNLIKNSGFSDSAKQNKISLVFAPESDIEGGLVTRLSVGVQITNYM